MKFLTSFVGPQAGSDLQTASNDPTALSGRGGASALSPDVDLAVGRLVGSNGTAGSTGGFLRTQAELAAPPAPVSSTGTVLQDDTQDLTADGSLPDGTTTAPADAPYVVPPLDESAHPVLNAHQIATIAVLQRHADHLPFKISDIDNPDKTKDMPPDLKQAWKEVQADPTLQRIVDSVPRSDGHRHLDGKVGKKELDYLATWPEIKKYNKEQAASYLHNYVPSDAKDGASAAPRDMTANDAAREFYLYSDNLPKNLDPAALQAVVDGQMNGGKCPPQLAAAAEYFLKNPADWKKLTVDKNGQPNASGWVSRGNMLDTISHNVYLNDDENQTLKTIDKNRDVFFGHTLTRDGIQAIIDDKSNSKEVRTAAQQLLDDPLLFGMIDNGKNGSTPSKKNKVDDGKLAAVDFDSFMANLTTKNRTPPALPPSKAPSTPQDILAVAAMRAGVADDPAQKKTKGGGGGGLFGGLVDAFKKMGDAIGDGIANAAKAVGHAVATFAVNAYHETAKLAKESIKKVISPILKIGAVVMDVVSIGLSMFSKLPIIGEATTLLSVMAEGVAGSARIINAAITGGNVGLAAEEAGIGVAGAVIGNVIAPGVGAVLLKGAEKAGVTAAIDGAATATRAAATKLAEKTGATQAAEAASRATSSAVDGAKAYASKVAAPIIDGAKALASKVAAPIIDGAKALASKITAPISRAAEKLGITSSKTAGEAAEAAETSASRVAMLRKTMSDAYESFTKPLRRAGKKLEATQHAIGAPFVRAGNSLDAGVDRAAAAAASVARSAGRSMSKPLDFAAGKAAAGARNVSYRLGLSAPEKEVEELAGKATQDALEEPVAAEADPLETRAMKETDTPASPSTVDAATVKEGAGASVANADAAAAGEADASAMKEAEDAGQAKEAEEETKSEATDDAGQAKETEEETKAEEAEDEEKVEEDPGLMESLLSQFLQGTLDFASLSLDDIALLMAMLREMQKERDSSASQADGKKPTSKNAAVGLVLEESLKGVSRAA